MFGYAVRDGLSMEERFHGRSSFFWEELKLAKLFVLKSAKPDGAAVFCPTCGTPVAEPFFAKWGLAYHLCDDCWTLFAPALSDEVKTYEKASPLTELRRGREYQDYALESRKDSWNDLSTWLEHRVFRYLGTAQGQVALVRGLRYKMLLDHLRSQPLFKRLDVKGSIVSPDAFEESGYDLVLYLDSIQRRLVPLAYLTQAHTFLRPGGRLFLTARVSTGFDVLSLQGRTDTLFPYEHVFLPSVQGLTMLLQKAGFEVLECSTPGMLDVARVFRQRDALSPGDLFLRFLMSEFNERMFADFQKFLQKHGLSSSVHMVARKQ
jgi:hypothetical protein